LKLVEQIKEITFHDV